MCLDHPERVIRAALLDIYPTRHLRENFNLGWAMDSWRWVLMPETNGTAHWHAGRRSTWNVTGPLPIVVIPDCFDVLRHMFTNVAPSPACSMCSSQ